MSKQRTTPSCSRSSGSTPCSQIYGNKADAVEGLERLGTKVESDDDGPEPSLARPAVGKPISHGQIVYLWTTLQSWQHSSYSLEKLLQGSRVFVPPPPPKREPSDEYKALMARLRHEEASRAYQRMVKPSIPNETFHDGFPTAAQTFATVNRPAHAADLGDDEDEVTYAEVQRQVMLIINFLVSIVGVAGTLWVVARWWSLPARLLLALSGAMVVAVAETVVYRAYVWRMGQARVKQKAVSETKEVVNTWVVGQGARDDKDSPILLKSRRDSLGGAARRRIPAATEPPEGETKEA
ncbi:hypothetical protein XA68_15894 [Ophiocordyceps unilateralis]|uniref:Endoplasmic reticulum-based factor for assembly of V-ATPase n=1 Tax=Ophiocordyceps unilateralis TaxID=268505 RepID=A0A2A9PT64_OPHUN|nr:hypothetical protein XA68_15894 [Ophiocordyceps unilateralis]